MFESFQHEVIDVGGTTIAVRRGGGGAPVLLLHGFPETHLMWHRVAPGLADDFAVVCADLRGYGASGTPASTPDYAPYTKEAMAGDMVLLMERLGFERHSVVGHDRGARVAYRLASTTASVFSGSRFSMSSQRARRWTERAPGWHWAIGRGRCWPSQSLYLSD